MAGISIDDLALRLGWRLVVVRQRLCVLRAREFGQAGVLWHPERAGRPVCLLSRVCVWPVDTRAMRAFETWCLADERISRADVVTGRYDYNLWSWHVDIRAAAQWSREVELRDEVKACVSRPMSIRFGHMLAGAPIFTRGEDHRTPALRPGGRNTDAAICGQVVVTRPSEVAFVEGRCRLGADPSQDDAPRRGEK